MSTTSSGEPWRLLANDLSGVPEPDVVPSWVGDVVLRDVCVAPKDTKTAFILLPAEVRGLRTLVLRFHAQLGRGCGAVGCVCGTQGFQDVLHFSACRGVLSAVLWDVCVVPKDIKTAFILMPAEVSGLRTLVPRCLCGCRTPFYSCRKVQMWSVGHTGMCGVAAGIGR